MEPGKKFNEAELHGIIRRLLNLVILLAIAIVLIPVAIYSVRFFSTKKSAGDQVPEKALTAPLETTAVPLSNYWTAPEFSSIKDANLKAQIEYGKDLIAHTSNYLGPNGSVARMSNGLNCQNCHLNAGTKVFGNNYGSVASTYPKMRARSGSVENIYKRVNDCFERSLNGQALDTTSKEMQAIVAYINFLGSNVEKGKKAEGSGFKDLAYLDRPADPEKGKAVYETKCQSCHQANGEGLLNPAKTEYTFPALWGKASYNDGAGLYRISNFAKYVKYNMPQGVSHDAPQLSDEEAWDVAAFVNTQPRPHINVPKDWPDKSKKPVDHPFGPYADKFTEKQHKFGPYQPIADLQKKNSKK
jgi:thiosulfate dehydrogenase